MGSITDRKPIMFTPMFKVNLLEIELSEYIDFRDALWAIFHVECGWMSDLSTMRQIGGAPEQPTSFTLYFKNPTDRKRKMALDEIRILWPEFVFKEK